MGNRLHDDPINRSSHDDPVVVDNGPLRVDFGKSPDHRPTKDPKSDKKWIRECTDFAHLIVAVVVPGLPPVTHTFHLQSGKPLKLLLERSGSTGPQKGHLTLTTKGSKIEVHSPDFKHSFDNSRDPRFLLSDRSEAPLVTEIQMYLRGSAEDAEPDTFIPDGTPGSRVLYIALVPVPEGYAQMPVDARTAP